MKSTFSKFVDDTKLRAVLGMLEEKVTIQRNFNVLEKMD